MNSLPQNETNNKLIIEEKVDKFIILQMHQYLTSLNTEKPFHSTLSVLIKCIKNKSIDKLEINIDIFKKIQKKYVEICNQISEDIKIYQHEHGTQNTQRDIEEIIQLYLDGDNLKNGFQALMQQLDEGYLSHQTYEKIKAIKQKTSETMA